MRDKNFFEPYVDKKNKSDENRRKLILIGGGIGIILFSYTFYNIVRVPMLKREINRISNELNEKKLIEKKESVDNKKELLAELKQIETEIDYVSLELNEKDKLGVYLVETITNSMPSDIFLKSIDINEDLITLEGISRTKESIAQLESNLRQVIYFKDVFIPGISSDEGFYSFTITMSLTEEGLLEQEKAEHEDDKEKEKESKEDEEKEEKDEDNKDKEDDKDETQ